MSKKRLCLLESRRRMRPSVLSKSAASSSSLQKKEERRLESPFFHFRSVLIVAFKLHLYRI